MPPGRQESIVKNLRAELDILPEEKEEKEPPKKEDLSLLAPF